MEGLPSFEEAKEILEEAGRLNPGPWIQHSINSGKAAALIAKQCEHLDSEKAMILGMLHDIGRRYGVTGMRHIVDGYNFAIEKNYHLLARICLTHSFDYKNVNVAMGTWDCNEKELQFVKDYLQSCEYDDYDKLIQLCDSLACIDGYCIMEKRMIDTALRHGTTEYTFLKWRETFKIKTYFESIMGKSIYNILPGVKENTFEM